MGGLNLIEFLRDGAGVRVEPVVCRAGTLEGLHRSLMLFFTGKRRSADSVLAVQRDAITRDEGTTVATLCAMRDLAYEMRDRLAEGDLEGFGALLDRNWQLKRSLTDGITNPEIDAWHDRAPDAGAAGAKLLGPVPRASCS